MPTVTLHHHYYTQIDPVSWCVIAQLISPQQPYNKREQQRNGVRQLLQDLLYKIGIGDSLDETQFPYRLSNSGHYVCFSHSENKVAVVLSSRRAVGIDIEVQNIRWHIAQRFYHSNEIAILAELPIEQRVVISKYLWQLKESFIKIYQYKLAQGLGMNYAYLVPDLVASLAQGSLSLTVINANRADYQIALLPLQQTVIVF